MCGVIGVIGNVNAAREVYQGLLLLQHRGQDAAGIITYDSILKQFHLHKDKGLVGNVFSAKQIERLEGDSAVGHTRYATIAAKKEASRSRDLQPMVVNYPYGLALAHNGNIVNSLEQKEYLKTERLRHLLTENDIEVILNVMADGLIRHQDLPKMEQITSSVADVMKSCQGGFAVAGILAEVGMVAFRDPNGIRPLILGEKSNMAGEKSYIVASESTVVDFLGYTRLRDVRPGELLVISPKGELTSRQIVKTAKPSHCMFEWIYFATPESEMDGQSVYRSRLNLGRSLGNKIRRMMERKEIDPEIVIPVPETSRLAAITVSEQIGVPYRELLIKNRYIQRSFILPDQSSRELAVQLKLMPIASEIKGKKVLLVDDSIVRGTTSRRLVDLVKQAGAKEVYFASTCPPIKHPCYFGIDFPDQKELVAAFKTNEEVTDILGATKVIYQEMEDLKTSLNDLGICHGCLDGQYPIDIEKSSQRFLEARRLEEGSVL